jgi:DNA-binding transcriptional MerR regulator
MLINELSKRTGITAHTIRFYENKGLLQGQVDEAVKSNNYKHYDESHIERIEIIREAQEVGFTLAEIKNLLEKWYSGNFFKDDQLDFFDVKLKEIDSKINQLKQMKKRLEEVRKLIESGVCQ